MRGCDHDKIYSGAMNLDRKFSCICRKCGECWWDDNYEISRVDLDQYHALMVLHGWAAPRKLPAPPRVPNIVQPESDGNERFVVPMLVFAALFVICGLAGVPVWGTAETIMPRWLAMMTSGLSLLVTTFCYVGWKMR